MATTLIVNPYATRVTRELVDVVARELGAERVLETKARGHATELAAEVEDGAVVVLSGDGGYNEVLNGLRPGVAAGFVPGGGTSVLPRALGLPHDPVAAARRIAAGRTRRISLGRANGRRFGFSAGIGFDAELVRRMDARGRDRQGRRPGDAVFAWTTLRLLVEHRARFPDCLEVEGAGRAAFALVANADPYSYAGPVPLHLVRDARFEGGLDLVAPRSLGPQHLPGVLGHLLTGRSRLPLLQLRDRDRIVVRCDRPTPLQLDGEDCGDVTEVVLEAERAVVDVLV